jgi:hypothetical protein
MSNPLLDLVTSSLDANTIGQLARQIGASPQATSKAASAAVPALINAINQQAQNPAGAAGLLSALDRDHDGSVLDDLGALLGGGGGGKALDGAGILGHILGGKREAVESRIGQASGLDLGSVSKLLELLAPLIMGALGRTRASAPASGGGLFDILGGAAKQTQQGGLGGMLGSLLDQDGDGDPTDDVARLGASVLGGLFGKK